MISVREVAKERPSYAQSTFIRNTQGISMLKEERIIATMWRVGR